ncbi:MAG: TonB-dependent receptor plug domain-containing protein, partial [Thiothrix sp.]
MPKISCLSRAVLSALALIPALSLAADNADTTVLDEVTVTATRAARGTKTVPAAVASVGQEKLSKLKMNSLSDALQNIPGVLTYSKNGLSDS